MLVVMNLVDNLITYNSGRPPTHRSLVQRSATMVLHYRCNWEEFCGYISFSVNFHHFSSLFYLGLDCVLRPRLLLMKL
jgi:hypothetical protein